MKSIIITKVDYTRIKESIKKALDNNAINEKEANALLKKLNSAQLIEPYFVPPNLVRMNSIVRVKFLNHNYETEIQIVYPKDVDSSNDKVSIFSPIAAALIGFKAGDEIEWVVPAGITKMKIMEVVYQPEKEGVLK